MQAVARRLGVPLADAESACVAIRRLDPRPGWRFGAPSVQYVTPDVIVRKVRGQWTAVLNDAVVPKVRLNRGYAELFRRHRGAEHAELGAHLQEARWTVRNVEQRFSTILAVAQAILKRQHRFLAYGAMAMKPLALREIAQEVGVHESTVSRVTNNKFMATPCGVYELKYFFSRGLATASGGECSPTAIRGLIQELIAAESATAAAVGRGDRAPACRPGAAGRAPHRHQVPAADEDRGGRAQAREPLTSPPAPGGLAPAAGRLALL